MTRFTEESQAAAAGLRIVHEPDAQRYAIFEAGEAGDRLVGEAHYTLIGSTGIDFDHTVVLPELRGTGISGLLAHHVLTGDVIGTRRVTASCSFIARYLHRHPEILAGPNEHTPSAAQHE